MPFSKPKFEKAPASNKQPTGSKVKKGSKLDCLGCKDGKTLTGVCTGCKGTGKIIV